MATRVYVRSEGTPDITPSSWNFANQINPVSLPGTLIKNSGSAMTSKTEATGTTNPTARAMGRTIIGPLVAQTISGTIKGQMRGSESNAGANATLALAVKIIKSDGTDRAVLLAQTASDSATAGNELTTTLTNMSFKNASESASISLTSQSALDGDYLVIEWGFRSATSQTRDITLSYGNDSATDLPEDTSTTAANNPWFEFSSTISIVRTTVGSSSGVGTPTGVGAPTATASGSSTGTGTATATAVAFASAVGSASGQGDVLGVGASFGIASGSASSSSSVTGTLNTTGSGAGQSTGLGDASGIASSTAESVGSTSGTSSVSGTITAQVETVGSSSGTSSVDGVLVVFAAGVGASQGTASASGVGQIGGSIEPTVGSASGNSNALGVSVSAASSVGSGAGVSVALGVATSHVQLVPDFSASVPAQNFSVQTVVQNHESNLLADNAHTVTVPSENRRTIA